MLKLDKNTDIMKKRIVMERREREREKTTGYESESYTRPPPKPTRFFF